MNSELLTLEISNLGEETVFNKVISSPKNKLLLEKHSSPALVSAQNLVLKISAEIIEESKIVTADITSQLTENLAPIIAVPFCSHAIESVFHCFPFAELYSSDQNDDQDSIAR